MLQTACTPRTWKGDKKTRASEPLGVNRAEVQRKNIFASEVMLPESLSFTEKIYETGQRSPPDVLVKKLHQESENFSKAEYIFSHLFGATAILMGTLEK